VLATQNPIEQEGTYPLPEAQLDRFLMKVVIGYAGREAEGGHHAGWFVPRKARRTKLRWQRRRRPPYRPRHRPRHRPPARRAAAATALTHLADARRAVHRLHVAPAIEQYIVDLIQATREPASVAEDVGRWIEVGASPRGTIALDRCSRAHAWLQGRDFVGPDDVRAVLHACLRHRLLLSHEALAAGCALTTWSDRIAAAVAAP
jgi:MoxR-like ATPase